MRPEIDDQVDRPLQHALDAAAFGNVVGEARGRLALRAHAHGQGLQALQHDPGIERRQAGAGLAQEGVQMVLEEFLG